MRYTSTQLASMPQNAIIEGCGRVSFPKGSIFFFKKTSDVIWRVLEWKRDKSYDWNSPDSAYWSNNEISENFEEHIYHGIQDL